MKTNSVMKKVFLAVAVSNLALSVPVVAQNVDVAEAKNRTRKIDKLISRLKNYSPQGTYKAGYQEGSSDQREIDRLNNKFDTTKDKLQDEITKESEQLDNEYKRRMTAATSVDEQKQLYNEYKNAANSLGAEHKQKINQQLGGILEDINIVRDARNINLMQHEYASRAEAAPYKIKQLRCELSDKVDAYLKEHGYAE
jgi:hypothetical protein